MLLHAVHTQVVYFYSFLGYPSILRLSAVAAEEHALRTIHSLVCTCRHTQIYKFLARTDLILHVEADRAAGFSDDEGQLEHV